MKPANIAYFFLAFIALLTSAPLASQVQSRFVLAGSIDFNQDITTVNDSTYLLNVNVLSDQTGNSFMASQIATGWRLFTNTKRMYRISASEPAGFTARRLTLVEVKPTDGPPNGTQLVVYQYDGSNLAIPTVPVNSAGISGSFAGIIGNHNFIVLNQIGGDGNGGADVPIKTYEYTESASSSSIPFPFAPDYTRTLTVFRNGVICASCTIDQQNNEIDLSTNARAGEVFTVLYY